MRYYNAVIGVAIAMLVSFIACWIMFGIWAKKGKLDPKELGRVVESAGTIVEETKDNETVIYAPVEGELVDLTTIKDEVFSSLAM